MDDKLLEQLKQYIDEHYGEDTSNWTTLYATGSVRPSGGLLSGLGDLLGTLGGMLGGGLGGGGLGGKISDLPRYNHSSTPSPQDLERLKEYLSKNKEVTFVDLLMAKIDERDLKDADVYKNAGQSRQQFSKMRSNRNYHVSKDVAISYALSLKLNKEESLQLLNAAGHTFATNDRRDLGILFCIDNEFRSIDAVNQVCIRLDCKPLCDARN